MSPPNLKFQKSITDNGIRVVTEQIPYVRSISLGVWFKVGSRWENTHNNGISHFIEHMVFKGTEKRSAKEIAQSMESVGGNLNAFTGKELTCFYAHFLDEYLPVAIDILADITSRPLFNVNDLQKEKQVVIEEIKSLQDTPDELVHEYFQENLFYKHPLGLSVLGSIKNIYNLDRNEVLDFWKKNYTSGRVVISAAGNLDHEKLCRTIEEHFRFNPAILSEIKKEEFKKGGKNNIFRKNVSQAHICIGCKALSYKDEKKYSLMVLNVLLGGGMSSRLFQNIREKLGIAYNIYSFIDFYEDSGVFGAYIGTEPEKVDDSIKLIIKEFSKIKNDRLTDDEVEMAKSQLKGNLMLGLESTESRMTRLGRMEMYLEEYITLDQVLDGIEKVKKEEIRELAEKLLCEDNLYTTMIIPDN